MKQNRFIRKKTAVLFASCFFVFLLSVSAIFTVQQRRLNGEFDQLVSDNLSSYTQGQRRQAHGVIRDIQNTLSALARMIETTGLSPSEPWLGEYLENLGRESALYQIDYLNLDELQAQMGQTLSNDEAVLSQLLQGQEVVTDIRYSERLGGKYVFSVAEPVFLNGEVVGVLRTRMDASFLLQFTQKSSMFQNVRSLIVDEEGNTVFSGAAAAEYHSTGNLFVSMKQEGVSDGAVDEIQRLIKDEPSASYRFERDGKEYFMTVERVQHNGWRIVNFVRSPDVLVRSDAIGRSVIFTGILLIAVTVLLCGAAGLLLAQRKRRLDLELQRYAVLSQFSDTVLFEYDCAADLLLFTPNAQNRLELKSLQLRGISNPRKAFCLLHPDDRGVINTIFHPKDLGEDGQLHDIEARLKSRDGAYRWYGCQYKFLLNSAGRLYKVIGKLVDITDQRGREQALLERAQRDQLTDIYNKAGCQIIDSLVAASGKGLFFMIDLNHFKAVNDTYGHQVGDDLLLRIAAMLKNVFRADDIIARVGGDEFVAFVPDTSDREVAKAKAVLIQKRINALEISAGKPSGVSASIGIAIAPMDGDRYQKLYQAADEAMYLIKKSSRHQGGFAFYSERGKL